MSETPHPDAVRDLLDGLEAQLGEVDPGPVLGAEDVAPVPGTPDPPD